MKKNKPAQKGRPHGVVLPWKMPLQPAEECPHETWHHQVVSTKKVNKNIILSDSKTSLNPIDD